MKRLSTFAATALIAGLGLAPVPAAASDVVGVPLASGTSVYRDQLTVAGVSSEGPVYRRVHRNPAGHVDQWGMTVGVHRAVGGQVEVAKQTQSQLPAVVGSMVTYAVNQWLEDYSTEQVHHWNVATGVSGTATLDETDQYVTTSPTGWLITRRDPETGDRTLLNVDAVTGATTDLGEAPWGGAEVRSAVGDADGVVVTYTSWSGEGERAKAVYVPFDPAGEATQLDVGETENVVHCTSIGGGAAGCFETDEYEEVGGLVIRAPLDGGAALHSTREEGVGAVALTGTTIAWTTADDKLATMPVAGGAVTVSTGTVGSVAANGSGLVIATGGIDGTDELRTVSGANDAGQLLVPAAYSPVSAGALAIGPGRVAWTDSSAAGLPVWSATVARGDTGLTVGPKAQLKAGSEYLSIAVSGRRTAFITKDPAAPADDPVGVLNIAAGSTVTAVAKADALLNHYFQPDVSGTRALFNAVDGWGTGGWTVVDLATGTSTRPTWLAQAATADLWGNYVAFVNMDGSVWRKDLASTAGPVKLLESIGTLDAVSTSRVIAWDDYVAWDIEQCTAEETCTPTAAYRNAATLAPAVAIVEGWGYLSSIGSDGLVLAQDRAEGGYRYVTRDLTTGVVTPIPGAVGNVNAPYTDSGLVVWATEAGQPRVSELTVKGANRPRFLGNPITKLTRTSASAFSWSGEVVTSAALTSCNVAIKSGTTLVRTLACDTANAAQGTALVSWDGKNASGVPQIPGAYTWTLNAANADGAVRAANGSTAPVTGTIAVPAVKPVVTKNPVAKTVYAGKAASFVVAASGAPAPAVQWQVSANKGATWTNLTGKRSATLSFTAAKSQNGYRYRAVFTNSAGTATTTAAALTVK